jgi:excisionase family DNA binding protein
MEDKLLTIGEVSKYLRIPQSTIYKLSRKKELPSCKIGKQLRFRKSSVDGWLTAQEAADAKIDNRPSGQAAAKRILLIDDDAIVLRTMTKFLQRAGYHVEPANNGEEAVAKVRTGRPDFDLIITDVRMPGIDGIETIKTIRGLLTKRKKPSVPEIVITGYMNPDAERQAQRLKIADYVHKPFSIGEFLETINRKLTK